MALILAETAIEIKSKLNYCMFETDDVETIKNLLHEISWAFNREVMFKFENRDLHEAEQIAEIDKIVKKLTEIKLELLTPNTLLTCPAAPFSMFLIVAICFQY